jgi:glycosyltransferase involved in cell wall biosynthesis
MSAPTFSIVVPTFRRPDALRTTLAALLALEYDRSRYEVIVVDDGADEMTAEVVDGFDGCGVSVALERQRQRGAASARNRGVGLASGDLVLFCDDDMVVEPSHLKMHLAPRRRHGDVLVSAAWQFAPGVEAALRETPFGRYRIDLERRYQFEAAGTPVDGDPGCLRMPLLGSGNLSLRREAFWELGGFDENFPVAGAEDQDFSVRARDAGFLLLLDTRIRCFQDDNRITLRSYCAREERSAQTMPFMARKYPGEFGEIPYVRENRPISRGDSPGLVAKKLLKEALAADLSLRGLHRLADVLEAIHVPDRLLWPLYARLLGLHLFRGFRQTWRQ